MAIKETEVSPPKSLAIINLKGVITSACLLPSKTLTAITEGCCHIARMVEAESAVKHLTERLKDQDEEVSGLCSRID